MASGRTNANDPSHLQVQVTGAGPADSRSIGTFPVYIVCFLLCPLSPRAVHGILVPPTPLLTLHALCPCLVPDSLCSFSQPIATSMKWSFRYRTDLFC